jgi:putative nucleotidyltransferase with HDIG domain
MQETQDSIFAADESARILVVDDDRVIRDVLSDFLSAEGYLVRAVEDGVRAIEELQATPYDIVISDLKMPNMGGLELLEEIGRHNFNVLTVIMTGFGTVESAIEAMKRGAYDYILKPFKLNEVIHIVNRGLERQRLEIENIQLKEAVNLYRISEVMATSQDLDDILELIMSVSLKEADADMVALRLYEEEQAQFVERIRRTRPGLAEDIDGGDLDLDEMLRVFEANEPLRVHGVQAHPYFERLPADSPLVSFCAVALRVQERLVGVLSAYSFTQGRRFTEGQRKVLNVLGSRAAVSIENARLVRHLREINEQLVDANKSLQENFLKTIQGFALALEENDRYTRGHSERVSTYARLIAEGLGLERRQVELAIQAGLLHDIGKIGIRYEKLNKPGKLTPDEVAMFRRHPTIGRRILEGIPFMQELIPGILHHHEHFDGSGYPEGLNSKKIPLLGRIICVADTYDAMTSDRPYRKALPHAVACEELVRCSGTQFDPEVVEVFLRKIEIYRDDCLAEDKEMPK